jgi:hypothetical protein
MIRIFACPNSWAYFAAIADIIKIAKTFLFAAVVRVMAGRPDCAEGIFDCSFMDRLYGASAPPTASFAINRLSGFL